MTEHDLVVIDNDYIGAYQSLDRIAGGFAENAQVVEDVQDALGHAGLAAEFKTFSDSWRIKRDAMQKAFEALSKGIKTQYQTWVDTDDTLGGKASDAKPSDTPPQPANTNSQPANSTTSPSSTSAASTGSQSTSSSGASSSTTGGSSLPTATPTTDATATGSAPTTDPGAADSGGPTTDPSSGAAAPVVGAMTGAGVLGAIYALWKSTQDAKTAPVDAGTSDASSGLSVRDRINQELAQLKGVSESGYTVELTADPKDPDDIMAVLRGKDGDTLTLAMEDGDANGASADAAAGAEQAETAADDASQVSGDAGSSSSGSRPIADPGTAPVAAEAAPAEALAPAAGAAPEGSSPSHAQPASAAGVRLSSPLATASGPSMDLPGAAGSAAGGADAATPLATSSVGTAGMMGMGALGAQHMMAGSGTTVGSSRPREQLRPAEPVADDDAERKDQK